MKFNLSTRIELFAICTSLEIDIKRYITETVQEIPFTEQMIAKAKERKKDIDCTNEEQVLDQLDLGDYGLLIMSHPCDFGLNNDKVKVFKVYMDKIVPIRNRVMHTKPLELGDRALLLEVLEKISKEIPWIEWKEILHTKHILETDPCQLINQKVVALKEYNPRIYHNLPSPEFDDTGFIGREKSVKEIKDVLLNHKNQIVTVVGNGGIGKTAITVKTLYDLIDDPRCEFECVLWITLKTKTLSNGEFVEIHDAITSLNEVYEFSKKYVIADDNQNPEQMLLNFMEDFKTLLVLDNLETLNLQEINEFMDAIPENSKVLITSRHGLGELEKRIRLGGLDKKDCITYFRELSKYYGLELHKRSDAEIVDIAEGKLYSNPLSIKWYMNAIYNGMNERKLLANKEELVNFCISNVYEKLSDDSKTILQVLLLQKKSLSYGALDFYMDIDEAALRETINELLSTYMIEMKNGEFFLNEMSREFISINYPPSNELVAEVQNKRKIIKNMMQQTKIYSEAEPFNPRSISSSVENEDKEFTAYYLQQALNASHEKKWDEAKELCEKAASICPNFCEVYKIKAFINAERGESYGAISNYEIALTKCKTDEERAIICYLFSKFYSVKMQNLDLAQEYIEQAEQYMPDTSEIMLERARVYIFIGKFDDAETLLTSVEKKEKHFTMRTQNVLASIWGELYRRRVEKMSQRDYAAKVESYKKALDKFASVDSLDMKSGLVLLYVLNDLSYCLYDKASIELMISSLEKYSMILGRINHAKKQRLFTHLMKLEENLDEQSFRKIKLILNDKISKYDEVTSPNEGIVTSVKELYGFISNNCYKGSNAVYFSKNNAYSGIQVGDIVRFEVLHTGKGLAARRVEKINRNNITKT